MKIFTGGRIYTLDPARPVAEALAVRDGRIVAVGASAELARAWAGAARVDLGGRTVLPGFVDSHIHLAGYGFSLTRVDLRAARTPAEAVAQVAAVVARHPPGEWVLGRGWDKNVWPDGRLPTRADLDPVSPRHPVALGSKDGHLLWVNSLALRLAGVDRRSPDPPGGEIVRDHAGEPTGVLKERATDLVWRIIPPPDEQAVERAIAQAVAALHERGIVGVHAMAGTDPADGELTLRACRRLADAGRLRLRVWVALPLSVLDEAAETGLRTGVGDDWVRVGPVKIFADGTLGSQTASMLEPFDGQPDNTGIAVLDREELIDALGRAVEAGWWCAVHAIGDRAVRWTLDACEAHHDASRRRGARHRIEHAQLVHPDDVPRLAALGVVASMQPVHCPSDREVAERYWGRRCRWAYPWRSLREAGVVLAFGSDAPVEPPGVLEGLHAAVTRRRPGAPAEAAWHPEQALTLEEAVRAYTLGAAHATGEDRTRGALGPGRAADCVVLSDDPFAGTPDDLLRIRVVATVVAGEVVYAGPGWG
ncbi:MAG: amidohydrolase [Armatimonadota bacterium]|nr:amidohydrolase [Armatimonadota bacterium]MDR7436208.1 amidohydrolase [Armatimonadota bacterium]MDR7471411.1 amidohydrolase [Armatimonadota bacterium]MDR7507186.1 amidohydrolase [Armatimonadota bacterium]MDR7509550.1 amidohydrolase [Armatimonadota bacterium]